MPQTAKPFGKRNRSTQPYAALIPADTAASEAFLKFTASLAEERQVDESESARGRLIVPKSGRAALLAGLVAACFHVSLDLGKNIALGQHLGAFTVTGHTVPITAILLLDSLWSAARASVLGLFVVRAVLGRLEITNSFAYALSGGLTALLFGAIMLPLGWGGLAGLPLDCVTGFAAGYFYRLFAGTKAA